MGIYRTMQDNEICISLHRSSRSDRFFYLDVNKAIENATKLTKSIKETATEINSLENILDFFALKRIASFSAAINAVNEPDKQAVLTALTDLALATQKSFSTGKVIQYINNEYETLLEERTGTTEDIRNLFFDLVEFCIQFQTGVSAPVFAHLADKHWFVYITYYDELKKKLLAYGKLFQTVFSKENVKNLVRSKCSKLLEIAKALSGHNDNFNYLNEHILNCAIEIMSTAQDRDVLAYGDSIRRVRRYFSEIRYDQQKMQQFEKAYKEYDRKQSDYLDKHGYLFSRQIPGDMADKIMSSNAAWITKQLLMTHSLKEEKIVSQFTFPDPEEPSLVDMVSHNIDTDEYFTYSRQQKIQIAGSVGTALIMQIYNNPQYKEDCMTAMAGILSAIASKCGFQDDDLITDLIAIDQSLQFVDAARKKNVDDKKAAEKRGDEFLSLEDYMERYFPDARSPSQSIYYAQGRLVPADQIEEARAILRRKILKETANGRMEVVENLQEVLDSLTTTVDDGKGNGSIQLTREQAGLLARASKTGDLDDVFKELGITIRELIKLEDIMREAFKSGMSAAIISFVIHVTPVILNALSYLIQSERINAEKLRKDGFSILDQTAKSFILGSISAGVTIAVKSGYLGDALQTVSPTILGAVIALAYGCIERSFKLAVGGLTKQEYAQEMMRDGFVAVCSVASGAALQFLLCKIPVVAYLIGSAVGSVIGSLLYSTTERVLLSYCIESGYTFFGLVDQNYELSYEILQEMGLSIFEKEELQVSYFEYDAFTAEQLEYAGFQYERFGMKILKRGIIEVFSVGYI